MKCDKTCIWYQVYSGFDAIKNKPTIKIICDRKDLLIKDIPEEDKENCTFYKNKTDVNKWREQI